VSNDGKVLTRTKGSGMRVDGFPGCKSLAVVAAVLCWAAGVVSAADTSGGITVVGVGKVTQAPTQVEIPAMISGEAALAGDAIVKYRSAKKQALKALNELKVPGLKIVEQGFRMAHSSNQQQMMQMMMQGNVQQKMQQKVLVYERVKIVLSDVKELKRDVLMDTLVKIIDAAKDAGLITTGRELSMIEMQMSRGTPTSLVSFHIPDRKKLQEEAQRQAFADAKAKAERLARLAGLKLGKAVAIHESALEQPRSQTTTTNWYYAMLAAASDDDDSDSGSDAFAQVTEGVQLTVTFVAE